MDPRSSLELVRLAKAGDTAALDDLLKRYLPRMRRWAHGRLPRWARDIADTEDLLQETFAETAKRLPVAALDVEGALQAYLRQAVLNRIRNQIRRAIRHPVPAALDPDIPGSATSPLEAAVRAQSHERYQSALAGLTPVEREAVVGRFEPCLSFGELAALLGKPTADAARVALNRAVLKLSRFLTPSSG
jgi:RNA polymerase sigma factor (sigma-70 family)